MRILAVLGLLGLLIGCGDSQQPVTPESTEKVEAAPTEAPQAMPESATAGNKAVSEELMSEELVPEELMSEAPAKSMVDKTDPSWKSNVSEPAMMTFEPGKTYVWELQTNQGTMTFRLFHEESPIHVNSTIHLTELGFYDDTIFHRVIPDFMAQGGDPTGTGRGGPAYKYDGEFATGLSHTTPGLLSMANAGPGTDGSQFFITFVATPFLDGKHTIFGEITSGEEVLTALEARGSRGGKTTEMLKIVEAKILVQ